MQGLLGGIYEAGSEPSTEENLPRETRSSLAGSIRAQNDATETQLMRRTEPSDSLIVSNPAPYIEYITGNSVKFYAICR